MSEQLLTSLPDDGRFQLCATADLGQPLRIGGDPKGVGAEPSEGKYRAVADTLRGSAELGFEVRPAP